MEGEAGPMHFSILGLRNWCFASYGNAPVVLIESIVMDEGPWAWGRRVVARPCPELLLGCTQGKDLRSYQLSLQPGDRSHVPQAPFFVLYFPESPLLQEKPITNCHVCNRLASELIPVVSRL